MSKKQKQSSQSSSSMTPTFKGPEAQQLLKGLTDQYSNDAEGASANVNDAASAFRSQIGSVNPHAERLVGTMRAQAPRDYNEALSKVRTGGFRGGAGRDYINQAGLASDFSNQLNMNEAQILMDAFNRDSDVTARAAGGLGELGTKDKLLGTQLLGMLRGEDSTGTSAGTGKSSDMMSTIGGAAMLLSFL